MCVCVCVCVCECVCVSELVCVCVCVCFAEQVCCLRVTDGVSPQKSNKVEVHETYRLLKRKNMIIEAVRSSKIIEGFYT